MIIITYTRYSCLSIMKLKRIRIGSPLTAKNQFDKTRFFSITKERTQ